MNANFGSIGGGFANLVAGFGSTIGGGNDNRIEHDSFSSSIAGGDYNLVTDATEATIGGGGGNQISKGADAGTVGGGVNNVIRADAAAATISGGDSNTADAPGATVGGGNNNSAGAQQSTVGGGTGNWSLGENAVVGGGFKNKAYGTSSVVGGGDENIVSQEFTTVAGGVGNTASAPGATVGGGHASLADGKYATVPGGEFNQAAGWDSFAAGHRAKAIHAGSFVWADLYDLDVFSSHTNQFKVRCLGGAQFVTHYHSDSHTEGGVKIDPGGHDWDTLSDRNAKENFIAVSGRAVLEKLDQMPITQWNLKSQDASIHHLGPMAQDFHAAFGLGSDEHYINNSDSHGVALAAIKGLNEIVKEKDARISALERRLADLEDLVKSLPQKATSEK